MASLLRSVLVLGIMFIGVTSIGEEAAREGFGRLGCTVTNPRIDDIVLSNSDTSYGQVKNLIKQIAAKVAEEGLIESMQDDSTPRDCSHTGATHSGVFKIRPAECPVSSSVYCDMNTDGGNWTVIQRRVDGSTGFNRGWRDYRKGFGSRYGEYWLGNENLFWLTAQDKYELRVEMTDFLGETRYVVYDHFRVGDEGSRYKLLIGSKIDGNTGDSLISHRDAPFTTPDYDNDGATAGNCAAYFNAGWWFTNCYHANLNGIYRKEGETPAAKGIVWSEWRGLNISLSTTEMKIRPRRLG